MQRNWRLGSRCGSVFLSRFPIPDRAAQGTTFSTLERGRYLVDAGDCAACHTADGGQPFAGGRAIPTPFGTIYSTNITPDKETGIGHWSNQEFYKAMHEGIRRDGKRLYPAFPYPWYTKVGRDDVRAIKAYLDTLPPVKQKDKPSELPWPLSVREVMAGWNALYFHEGSFAPTRTNRRSGTAAPIWSKALAIAARVTPKRTCWARQRAAKNCKVVTLVSTGTPPAWRATCETASAGGRQPRLSSI